MEVRPTENNSTHRYAAYLYDIWDQGQDAMPEASSHGDCIEYDPSLSDQLAVGFGNLWDSFARQYPGDNFPEAGTTWTETWVEVEGWQPFQSDWVPLLTIAVHHQIYQNCSGFPP
jgi:hypothetical protein